MTLFFKATFLLRIRLRNLIYTDGGTWPKFFSTVSPSPDEVTVDYFLKTFGISRDSALSAAKRFKLKDTAKADAVVALLKTYGFTLAHIADACGKRPGILGCDPDKVIKPKLEYLAQNVASGRTLVDIISICPEMLTRSLQKRIDPCIQCLKNFFGSAEGIVSLFYAKRGTWVVNRFSENTALNIETLREAGVPDPNIGKIILVRPKALSWEVEEFREMVREIKEMGFDPKGLMFIHGLSTLTRMNKEKRVSKFEAFKSFGWSDEEVRALFVKCPQSMILSAERIKRGLQYFKSEWGWSRDEFRKYATVLCLSMEKRVLPRTPILQYLLSRGVITAKSVGGAYLLSDEKFTGKLVKGKTGMDLDLYRIYQEKVLIGDMSALAFRSLLGECPTEDS